jgi:glycosyltransferase involved in cell wall biosynthesis
MQVSNLLDSRVSVIIPHLNEPDDLRRCLAALVAQKADGIPFEIIVVDNGSRELPTEICAGVRLEQELTPGPGPARNRGASVAGADIIAFIDADCLADAGWIRGIVECFDRNPDVHCLAGDIQLTPATCSSATAIEAYERIFSYRVQRYVERDHFAATGNMAVRKEVFRTVGPFGGISVMEDNEWGQRATAQGFRIVYAPQVRVYTPPCKTFRELTGRWDRHIAHEFQEVGPHPFHTIKWVARSLAIAISPLIEVVRVMSSDRVSNLQERFLALLCVTRVRFYRSRKMLGLALIGDATRMVENWNRR